MSESQRLKHGKALCGKAFSRFVETFNELVDFKDNLKGDADLPTTHNGIVKVDRSDPAHPVLRTDLNELYRLMGAKVINYWVFSCSEDEDSGERTGGWINCKIQVGLNCNVDDKHGKISGTDLTDDGVYYVEVDVANECGEIKKSDFDQVPLSDLESNKVNIYVGKVKDGEQVDGIYCIPVVPKYL